MAQTAAQWKDELLQDPSVSYWLKDALRALFDRDCLDAARDSELLHRVMQRHLSESL